MRDIEIKEKIKALEEQMRQNAELFKNGELSYEELYNSQYTLIVCIEHYRTQLKGIHSCSVKITPHESYMIYDALTDMVFKASENKEKYANGYQMQEIQELADRFSKIQIQNQW